MSASEHVRAIRDLCDALMSSRPYVVDAVRLAERENWESIATYRRNLLDQIDNALAAAQSTL